MKNLAGNQQCDEFIVIELVKAKIVKRNCVPGNTEVPYSVVGSVGAWDFRRAWRYWVASADRGEGLPLEYAIKLHEKKFPIEHFDDYYKEMSYGSDIRCEGHAGGPHPGEYCKGQATVDSYHIDSQEGLNEFVRMVKLVDNIKSQGWDQF